MRILNNALGSSSVCVSDTEVPNVSGDVGDVSSV